MLELALGGGEEVWQVVEEQDAGEDILDRVMTQRH